MTILYSVAAVLFVTNLTLLYSLHRRSTYSPISHAVSDYGVGADHNRFQLYVVIGTAASGLTGVALLHDPAFPDRAGWYLIAAALMRIGLVAFPTDLEGEVRTGSGLIHYLFAIGLFALLYMAISLLGAHSVGAFGFWTAGFLRGLGWTVAGSLAGVVICMSPPLRKVFGLFERVFLVATTLWQLIFVVAVLIQNR